MKRAIQIFSYVVGGLMLLGALSLSSEGEMDAYTFLTFGLVLTQVVLTLVYVHDK